MPVDETKARALADKLYNTPTDDDLAPWLNLILAFAAEVRRDERERAAQVVDQCNREGPYNAIGAAALIRALSDAPGGPDPTVALARDNMIIAARHLEEVRKRSPHTFDMRDFWAAVMGISDAVAALALAEAP